MIEYEWITFENGKHCGSWDDAEPQSVDAAAHWNGGKLDKVENGELQGKTQFATFRFRIKDPLLRAIAEAQAERQT